MGCKPSKSSVQSPVASTKQKQQQAYNNNHNTTTDGRKLVVNSETAVSYSPASQSGNKRSRLSQQVIKDSNILHNKIKIGVKLTDYYDLTDKVLGTGVSGEVRVARHKKSGNEFAVKTLTTQGINEKKAINFQNEVKVYLKLDHPNICKLFEVYEDDDSIQLVMELCTGKELFSRLAKKSTYSERDAKAVSRQMLSAINYCHKHRICHRDLKLENWVYSTEDDDAPLKLIDFGFSRIFNPGIPMTAMHGTIYYVAPEVMDGCYEEKCDLWSIGVIVYMLLSGIPPFNGPQDSAILSQIKRAKFSFDHPRWSLISDDAKSFISRLLVKEFDQRASAAEALGHKWLQQDGTSLNHLDHVVIDNIVSFSSANVLKRACLALLAYNTSTSKIGALEKQFQMLDVDKTGTITINDLCKSLKTHLHMDDEEAHRIFKRLDQTGDQEVHYSEFLATTIEARKGHWKEIYETFDRENKGHIDFGNFRRVLGSRYDGRPIEEVFHSCDTDGDGFISKDEFFIAVGADVDDSEAGGDTPIHN